MAKWNLMGVCENSRTSQWVGLVAASLLYFQPVSRVPWNSPYPKKSGSDHGFCNNSWFWSLAVPCSSRRIPLAGEGHSKLEKCQAHSCREGKDGWFRGRVGVGQVSCVGRFGSSGGWKRKLQGKSWRVMNFRCRSLTFILKTRGGHGPCPSFYILDLWK